MHGPINLSYKYIAIINWYIFYQLFYLIPLNLFTENDIKEGDLLQGVSIYFIVIFVYFSKSHKHIVEH